MTHKFATEEVGTSRAVFDGFFWFLPVFGDMTLWNIVGILPLSTIRWVGYERGPLLAFSPSAA